MTSYLMQWNPLSPEYGYSEFDFKDWLESQGGVFARNDGWSFASHVAAHVGDTVYIRRSGKDRPGIVLKGTITGWTKPRPTATGKQMKPDVQFTVDAHDLENCLVPDNELLAIPGQKWRNQSSGVSIKADAARELDELTGGAPTIRVEVPEGFNVEVTYSKPKVRRSLYNGGPR